MSREIKAAAELSRRHNDGLEMFRALPNQVPALQTKASEYLLRGGNRSGKSTIAAVRFAGIARQKPVYGPNGEVLVQRMPHQMDRPLLMWVIGLSWKHIGDTIWRLLFKPGLYKIVRDPETKKWRRYHPIKDVGLPVKPSFPLIPMSEVVGGLDGIGWEKRKERQFSHIELINGTIIKAFASTGEVKMGDPVDEIWVDEEIAIVGHYPEWQARLSDAKGRIFWSSLSEMNPALLAITNRAIEQKKEVELKQRAQADVEEYVYRFSDNPFIDADEKRKRLEGWDDDNRKMRDEGEYTIGNIKVYPSFDRYFHTAVYEDKAQDDKLSEILRNNRGVPPIAWTRDLILDPGTAKPGVLFGAIPPPDLWLENEPYFVVYDEIYVPRLEADRLAERIHNKAKGYYFQRFIIDGQAARQTPMGFSGTVGGNYTKAFRKFNLQCIETGSSFMPGDPEFSTRSQIVEGWLRHRPCGRPQLRVVVDKCPNLVAQMEGNLKAIQKGPNGEVIVLDKPASGQKDDLRVGLEYWGSRYPTYVAPPDAPKFDGGPGMQAYKKIQAMFAKEPERERVHCGPGAAA